MYFYEQISGTPNDLLIYASPNFWVVLAFLVYMSATLFLFIITSSLSKNEQNRYWFIANFSSIIFNIFLSIAFILNRNNYLKSKKENEGYNHLNV